MMSELPATETYPDELEPPPRAAHPYRTFLMRAGFGVVILGVLFWRYDARATLQTLAGESPWYFAGAVALYVAGQVMSAWRWQLIAAIVGIRAAFTEFVAYYLIGAFTNLFVPGLVGGDAVRALYLGRRSHRTAEALASALADRGAGLLALFWFAAAVAAMLNEGVLPRRVIVATVATGAIALAIYLAFPILARAPRYAPRLIRRPLEIISPYLHRPASLLPAIGLSIVLQASLAVCQYLLARGLGLKPSLSLFMLVVPITNVFASLPVTLAGLGVRETAYAVLFGMAGMSRQNAIALGLLWFAAIATGGLTGAIAFVMTDARATPTSAIGPRELERQGQEEPLNT